MIAIESILYALLGGLFGLKLFLLGLAAILLVHTMMERTRQRKMASARAPVRPPRLDVHA